jgi:hypothetical protein
MIRGSYRMTQSWHLVQVGMLRSLRERGVAPDG